MMVGVNAISTDALEYPLITYDQSLIINLITKNSAKLIYFSMWYLQFG